MSAIALDREILADTVDVFAARRDLAALLGRLADAPLDPGAVSALRVWLQDSYPRAAAALDRLEASGADASPTPPPRGFRLPGGSVASGRVR